jgi:hypothetical protein
MIGFVSILNVQIGSSFSSFSSRQDQVSIPTIAIYPFTDQIASQGSIPSTRIRPDFVNSADQVSFSTIEVYSFRHQTANPASILSSQSIFSISDSHDPESIRNIEIYTFSHPTANEGSIPDDQINTYLQDCIESQDSIPSQHGFSSSQNTCSVREIPGETVGSFFNTQISIFSQQIS